MDRAVTPPGGTRDLFPVGMTGRSPTGTASSCGKTVGSLKRPLSRPMLSVRSALVPGPRPKLEHRRNFPDRSNLVCPPEEPRVYRMKMQINSSSTILAHLQISESNILRGPEKGAGGKADCAANIGRISASHTPRLVFRKAERG